MLAKASVGEAKTIGNVGMANLAGMAAIDMENVEIQFGMMDGEVGRTSRESPG